MKHSDKDSKLESLAEGNLLLKHIYFYGYGNSFTHHVGFHKPIKKNPKHIGGDAAHIAENLIRTPG